MTLLYRLVIEQEISIRPRHLGPLCSQLVLLLDPLVDVSLDLNQIPISLFTLFHQFHLIHTHL